MPLHIHLIRTGRCRIGNIFGVTKGMGKEERKVKVRHAHLITISASLNQSINQGQLMKSITHHLPKMLLFANTLDVIILPYGENIPSKSAWVKVFGSPDMYKLAPVRMEFKSRVNSNALIARPFPGLTFNRLTAGPRIRHFDCLVLHPQSI